MICVVGIFWITISIAPLLSAKHFTIVVAVVTFANTSATAGLPDVLTVSTVAVLDATALRLVKVALSASDSAMYIDPTAPPLIANVKLSNDVSASDPTSTSPAALGDALKVNVTQPIVYVSSADTLPVFVDTDSCNRLFDTNTLNPKKSPAYPFLSVRSAVLNPFATTCCSMKEADAGSTTRSRGLSHSIDALFIIALTNDAVFTALDADNVIGLHAEPPISPSSKSYVAFSTSWKNAPSISFANL